LVYQFYESDIFEKYCSKLLPFGIEAAFLIDKRQIVADSRGGWVSG